MKALLLALSLLFAQATLAEETAEAPPDFMYEVQPGDTLGDLARERLDTPTRWRDVARYNMLPNANLIEPGRVLSLKQVWLKARSGKLKVEALTGDAKVNGRALVAGDEVAAGAELETAEGAALRLRLPDGSLVNVMQGTQLQIEKLDTQLGEKFSTLLRLVTGQIETFKRKYPQDQSEMHIRTRGATIGVRGTHFRVRQDEQRSYAEIEEGLVNVDAAATPQPFLLHGAEGTVADGVHMAEAIPLLPAPAFPPLPEVFATPYIQWQMPAMAGAQGFAGELARDESFSDHLQSVRGEGGRINLIDLPNGRYWLRLRAVDVHGLQGMEGKLAFTVNVPPRKFAMTKTYITGSTIQLRWVGRMESTAYQVQISDNYEFSRVLRDIKTRDNTAEITRPQPGRYFMRVRQLFKAGQVGEWDVPMMFESPQ